MKQIVSILTLVFCMLFGITSASAGKICQKTAITATGKPNKFKQIAEANSFLKWKSIAKERHGDLFNKWSLADGHNKGCEKLLAGEFKGKWQCFRTGIACRVAKNGETATKPSSSKVVKKVEGTGRVKTTLTPAAKRKVVVKRQKIRKKKRVVKRSVRKKVKSKKITKRRAKKRVARSKITKRKKVARKTTKKKVRRAKRCRAWAVNAYGKTQTSVRRARASARKNWGLVVRKKYGARWARLSKAKGGSMGCVPKAGGTQCAVYAVPCS